MSSIKQQVYQFFLDTINKCTFDDTISANSHQSTTLTKGLFLDTSITTPCVKESTDVSCTLSTLASVLSNYTNMVSYNEAVEKCEVNPRGPGVENLNITLSRKRRLSLDIACDTKKLDGVEPVALRAFCESQIATLEKGGTAQPDLEVFILVGKNSSNDKSNAASVAISSVEGTAHVFAYLAWEKSPKKVHLFHYSCLEFPNTSAEDSLQEVQQHFTKLRDVAPILENLSNNIPGGVQPRHAPVVPFPAIHENSSIEYQCPPHSPNPIDAVSERKTPVSYGKDKARKDNGGTISPPPVSAVVASPYGARAMAMAHYQGNGQFSTTGTPKKRTSSVPNSNDRKSATPGSQSHGVFPEVNPAFEAPVSDAIRQISPIVSGAVGSPYMAMAMAEAQMKSASQRNSPIARSLSPPTSPRHNTSTAVLGRNVNYEKLLSLITHTNWNTLPEINDGVVTRNTKVPYTSFDAYCFATEMKCSLNTLHAALEDEAILQAIDPSLERINVLKDNDSKTDGKIIYKAFKKEGKMTWPRDYIVNVAHCFLTSHEAEAEGLEGNLGSFYLHSARSVEGIENSQQKQQQNQGYVRGWVHVDGICAVSTKPSCCKVFYYICIDSKGSFPVYFMNVLSDRHGKQLANLRRICMEKELTQLKKSGLIPFKSDPTYARTLAFIAEKEWDKGTVSHGCVQESKKVSYSLFKAYKVTTSIAAPLQTILKILTNVEYIKKLEPEVGLVNEMQRDDSIGEATLYMTHVSDSVFLSPRDYVMIHGHKLLTPQQAMEAGLTSDINNEGVLLVTYRSIDGLKADVKGFVRGYIYVNSYFCVAHEDKMCTVSRYVCFDLRGNATSFMASRYSKEFCKGLAAVKSLCEQS